MPPRTALRAGDRVAVPWGVDTRQGEVRAIYHTGDVEQVLVKLDASLSDLDEPQTIVLPVEAVTPLSENPDLPPAGSWLPGFRYERELAAALDRILAGWQPTLKMNTVYNDSEIDVLAESSRGVLVVEVKAPRSLSNSVFHDAIAQLRGTLQTLPQAKGLFVTPLPLPASTAEEVKPNGLLAPTIGAVQWRGPRDDKRLGRVIQALFNNGA
jgi:Holliday junction resolvase-like predicted endonuclease